LPCRAVFSRQTHPLTLSNYLASTSPLFIPSGKEVASTVSVIPNLPILRAFYLPTVSSLPIGMFWKIKDLTPEIMLRLLKALSSSPTSPYSAFIYTLESLGRRLHDWLLNASCHPAKFACQVFGYDAVESQFPSLVTGSFPDFIICTTTFAPLMDMRYPYAWRLLLDRILSGTVT
jgi:hypothetical protein